MQTTKFFVVALVTIASFPVIAQQPTATAQQSASANAASAHAGGSAGASATGQQGSANVNGAAGSSGTVRDASGVQNSASGSAVAAGEMRPVNAELVGKLDSKSAKVGDPVVVKTTAATKTADGVNIPKGTRLVGHVTSVQAHGSGSADSQMGIAFDHAELKGGQNLAIRSDIRSVAPSASAIAASSTQSEDAFGAGPMGGGGSAVGGGRAGGGLIGGGAAVPVREVAGTTNRAGSGIDSFANSNVHATEHATGQIANGDRTNLAAGASGNAYAHSTGVHGVMLAGDASGKTSGMLSASKQNVHLDSGTQMTLGVAAQK